MTIDPVVLLAEDLRSTEAALEMAIQLYARDCRRENEDLMHLLLGRTKQVYSDLCQTIPTSALGAAELIRLGAGRLPFAYARYAAHLHAIADRFSGGERPHADLVWIRALQVALAEGLCGKDGDKVAPLLHLAIIGASRPVTVFRAVQPTGDNTAWKSVLAMVQS